jgi:predicted ATPase
MSLPSQPKQTASDYPYGLPAVRALDVLAFHPKVTFFVGENGSGKSTLLEALAVALSLNPEGGSPNFRFATRDTHSGLGQELQLAHSPGWIQDRYFLRAESFYNLATAVDQVGVRNSYGGRSLHEQSHGESFFALFENRFKGGGLYLLDEPEAALSPSRQLSFLSLLHQLCRAGSQFVIATHSPIILAYPDSWIYFLGEHGIRRTEYRETEHYKITHAFLTRTSRMLEVLMADEDESPEKE